jgi:hypothetical protein
MWCGVKLNANSLTSCLGRKQFTVLWGVEEQRQPRGSQDFCCFSWLVSEQPCGLITVRLHPHCCCVTG